MVAVVAAALVVVVAVVVAIVVTVDVAWLEMKLVARYEQKVNRKTKNNERTTLVQAP